MAHWGWYWKIKQKEHSSKLLCSDLLCIDSFQLFNNKKIYAFTVPHYQLKAILEESRFHIYYGKKKLPSYSITIEQQKCNYGGYRHYFHCPSCHVRMRKLYFANGAFLCRKCLNLGYHSQRLRPARRYVYMRNKIEELIKIKGGDWYLSKKPLNMKNKTYTKIKNLWFEYDTKVINAFKQELVDWHGY